MEPQEPNRDETRTLNKSLNTPVPGGRRWRRAIVGAGRIATWAVLVPPRAGLRAWAGMRPAQQVVAGFAAYSLVGALVLWTPLSQRGAGGFVDHLFTSVSAVSTTGLTTISVPDTYTLFGELVILALMQIGGIGFMTLSSMLVLARGRNLGRADEGILRAGFSVPHYFVMQHFLVHVVTFTLLCETVGALLLWWRFAAAGVAQPLWSAVFHSVSAFATAGFSLNNNSLEAFAGDWVVNIVVGALCYAGAIGFIVAQDLWYTIKLRERMLTFTSKVILVMTAAVFVLGTAKICLLEPSLSHLPLSERLLAGAFQIMTASTTAGFNTVPIGNLGTPAILILMTCMLIGASPSGTGGGIKTTSVSAILGNLLSVVRGRRTVVWMAHEIPMVRVLSAFAATSVYLVGLGGGVMALSITERAPFLSLVFEAASAIGTVGLSMGITGDLTTPGKLIVTALMFAGRCGPLTIGLALLRPDVDPASAASDDLAV